MSVTEADFAPLGPWRDYLTDYRGAVILPIDPTGRVLLQLRDRNPAAVHPGEWGFFGGGVEGDEALDQAARREFEEETGIEAALEAFSPYVRIVSPVSRRRLYVFKALLDVAPADLRLAEGAGFGFFEPRDFARLPLVGSVRIVLAHWANGRAGSAQA
ncbi:MAG: NUDIX domain-containing protein [Pseudomonadota bacterium]